jgi:hypothetical protein
VGAYFYFRDDPGAAIAREVVLLPAGANLPPGAPPRGMRVTQFKGVFQVRATITPQDTPFDPKAGNANKRCKEYVMDLEAGKTYTMDLESTAFDAFLRVEDLKGARIMDDDDSGGNLNSRIFFTPAVSTSYVIVATSLSGGNGAFTLTVRESNLPKPR